MLPIPVFLPGKTWQGGGALVGYSPWGLKESDITDALAYFDETVLTNSGPDYRGSSLIQQLFRMDETGLFQEKKKKSEKERERCLVKSV